AGTIVISDASEDLAEVRQQLSSRNAAEARFRFDLAKLSRIIDQDVETVERLLDRWDTVPAEQRTKFVDQITVSLCRKMDIPEPSAAERVAFLEDLLAAEYRRQDRHLR